MKKETKNKTYKTVSVTVGHVLNEAGNEVPIRKKFRGKTYKEAQAKCDEYMSRIRNNMDTKTQYFGIVADRWLYNSFSNDESLALSTRGLYIRTWNKHLKNTNLYLMPLDKVSAGMIQETFNYMYKHGATIKTLETIRKTMKRFYKYLVQNGLTPFNFIDSITLPKKKSTQEKSVVVWSDEELRTILNSFDQAQNGFRLRFLMVMGAYTGMRISELLGLKYSDIKQTDTGYVVKVQRQVRNIDYFEPDGTKKTILMETELKTPCSYRTIPLPDQVIDELKIHRAWHRKEQMKNGYRTEFIFTTNTGGLVEARNTRRACERYYKNIGVPAKGFHTYRHTFGTNLYKHGVPIVTASRLMGHDDIATTQKYYIDIHEDDKRKAIELLARVI